MAYISSKYCSIHSLDESHAVSFLNGECYKSLESKRRQKEAAWKAQTTEEKLYDLHKRLEKLERGPIIY